MSSPDKLAAAADDSTEAKTPEMPLQARPPARQAPNQFGSGPDAQFQNFMGPMFAELEQQIKQQEMVLDEMNEKMEKERTERRKALEQEHIPKPLKGRGQDLRTVMKTVGDMITYEIEDEKPEEKEEEKKEEQFSLFQRPEVEEADEAEEKEELVVEDNRKRAQLRKLDAHANAAVTSHSLAAFLSCLDENHLRRFVTKVTSDCQLWLSKMFRFEDTSVFYHEDPRNGFVRVCRLALYQKYPKYVVEGFEALYSRPPVIYLSEASPPGMGSYICLQLGLPMSCISSVPCNSLFGSSTKIDTEILEKLIEDDIAAAKTPVALVAFAGTPTVGHVDDLETIQELCKKHNIWLHIEGNNLACLSLITPPSDVHKARFGDSITISMGKWLGVPAVPHATLFKASDPTLVHAAQLNTFNPYLKLTCLPLWVILQSLGIEGIEERIKDSCELASTLFEELERFHSIKQISRDTSKQKDQAIRSFSDLISKAITALLVFDMMTPTVVFRYIDASPDASGNAVASYAMSTGLEDTEEKEEERARKNNYYNALNVWLADSLRTENPNIEITTINVDREGVCMRFAPLESAQVKGTTEEHVTAFAKSLGENIAILDATVMNYEKFRMVVEQSENLRIVEVPNWAGLGAVQYIPDEYLDGVNALSEMGIKEVNNLNMELVHQLKSKDMAFSLGHTETDLACVKFGLIMEETDVQELVGIVQSTGREVQESSKYLESMSELIRQGIEAANKDLEEENQNKLIHEGVLRQIPMLSSMMNWWSPPPKNAVKGRTFNLASGTVSSTEETYKYKMQIQNGSPNSISPRSPRVSESGSSVGHPSSSQPQSPASPSVAAVSPLTKTAGDVKAKLLTSLNEGDLSEGHESLPSPNGNLRLNLESQESLEEKREP